MLLCSVPSKGRSLRSRCKDSPLPARLCCSVGTVIVFSRSESHWRKFRSQIILKDIGKGIRTFLPNRAACFQWNRFFLFDSFCFSYRPSPVAKQPRCPFAGVITKSHPPVWMGFFCLRRESGEGMRGLFSPVCRENVSPLSLPAA